MNLYESVKNNLKEADNFKDMVMELHGYVDYADPKKIAQDVKEALKNKTLNEYLKSKAAMDDNEIKAFKEKYAINESEEDNYIDSNYKVDTTNLRLTNGGYHNNNDTIFGRIKLIPENDKVVPGQYDIIYYPENDKLFVFKIGTDVRTIVNYLYTMDGTNNDEWIKLFGNRIQLKDIDDVMHANTVDLPYGQKESITAAISNAYFYEEPFPLAKVNYQ